MASVKNEIVANLDKLLQEYRLMYELDLSHKFKPIDTRAYALAKITERTTRERKLHKKLHTGQGARTNQDD